MADKRPPKGDVPGDPLTRLRHSWAHVMADAVKRLFPDAKLAIGPAIETGFYYDFDIDRPFTDEDMTAIEAEMKKIVAADLPFVRKECSRQEAISRFSALGERYKVDILERLPADATISFFQHGD